MITKEQALNNVKKYIDDRKRNYTEVVPLEKIYLENDEYINYGKYEEQKRDIYIVTCRLEGYTDPITHYVAVDAETGEILYTMTPHGYAEDWED